MEKYGVRFSFNFKTIKSILVLPYPTAEVESLFSKFKVVKTPYRNRLSVLNLEASLLSEQFFGVKDMEILLEMYAKFTSMWNPKKKKLIIRAKKSIEVQCDKLEDQPNINRQAIENGNDKATIEAITTLSQFLSTSNYGEEEFDYGIGSAEYQRRENSLKRVPNQNLLMNQNNNGLKLVKTALHLLSIAGLSQKSPKNLNIADIGKDEGDSNKIENPND